MESFRSTKVFYSRKRFFRFLKCSSHWEKWFYWELFTDRFFEEPFMALLQKIILQPSFLRVYIYITGQKLIHELALSLDVNYLFSLPIDISKLVIGGPVAQAYVCNAMFVSGSWIVSLVLHNTNRGRPSYAWKENDLHWFLAKKENKT